MSFFDSLPSRHQKIRHRVMLWCGVNRVVFGGLLCLFALCIAGCKPPTDTHTHKSATPPTQYDNSKIIIDANSVTLTKKHVTSIKSERFQPSFRLEGVLIPIRQSVVALPKDGQLKNWRVAVGEKVVEGMALADFEQKIPHLIEYASTDEPPAPNLSTAKTTPMSKASESTVANESKEPSCEAVIWHTERFSLHTPMNGKVEAILIHDNTQQAKATPAISIYDDSRIKFISVLPANYKNHISIGSAVQFDTDDGRIFSGQIEKITPDPKIAQMIDIHVLISPTEIKKATLQLGERVGGYVQYGQIDVGVLVPAFAVLDEQLSPIATAPFSKPPYKPSVPLDAYLWTVGQDEKLHLNPIKVIEYKPLLNQFLISGVSLDGLVAIAPLPKTADKKRVHLN